MSEERADIICFIDSSYKPLFYLPDGENIVITRSNGEQLTRRCEFLDSYHLRVGREIFYIYEFAVKMEKAGNICAPEKLPELPQKCASVLPATGELIFIEKGKKGYVVHGASSSDPAKNRREADNFNAYKKVTPQMESAMLGGALKGWASPAARVSSYDVRGNPIKSVRSKKRKPRETER